MWIVCDLCKSLRVINRTVCLCEPSETRECCSLTHVRMRKGEVQTMSMRFIELQLRDSESCLVIASKG